MATLLHDWKGILKEGYDCQGILKEVVLKEGQTAKEILKENNLPSITEGNTNSVTKSCNTGAINTSRGS